ncbi:MAG: hypothetical protein NT118_06690 [Lentisphaerae bacterium]|nr:hypothetical protein [Lentisphaerota bacterium]
MKKLIVLAVSAMALGLLVGCEDKQAELQQNQRMDAVSSEVVKLRNDLEEVKIQNQQLSGKISLVTAWLTKKVEEEKARTATKAATTTVKSGTASVGAKTSVAPTSAAKKKTNP